MQKRISRRGNKEGKWRRPRIRRRMNFLVGYLTTLSVSRAEEDKKNGKKVKINLIRKQSRSSLISASDDVDLKEATKLTLKPRLNSGQHCQPGKSTGQNSGVGLVRCHVHILFLRPVPVLECSWIRLHASTFATEMKTDNGTTLLRHEEPRIVVGL
jgi:hypothetical protein